MQKVRIPVVIDLNKAAQQKLSYEGVIPAEKLTRLSAGLISVDDDIDVTFSCGTDEQGLTFIKGKVHCPATATCQRCNGNVHLNLDSVFAFTPWNEKKAEEHNLPERYDPLEVERLDEIDLWKMFEDELILSIPYFPMHEESDSNCRLSKDDLTWGEIEEEPKPNPFDVLKELKRK